MNRLLVLGARDTATAWSHRFQYLLGASGRSANSDTYEAVLVVNDRSPAVAAHLCRALELKQRRPELAIAVLSVVEPADIEEEPLEVHPGVGATADGALRFGRLQAAATLAAQNPELSVSVRDGVLTLEYSG